MNGDGVSAGSGSCTNPASTSAARATFEGIKVGTILLEAGNERETASPNHDRRFCGPAPRPPNPEGVTAGNKRPGEAPIGCNVAERSAIHAPFDGTRNRHDSA